MRDSKDPRDPSETPEAAGSAADPSRSDPGQALPLGEGASRRAVLKLAGASAWCGALAYALAPIGKFVDGLDRETFLRKHYKELTPADKARIFRKLEAETREKYGVRVHIGDPQPQPGVKYAYALNLTTCIGCRRCVEACRQENNHDRRTLRSYVRVFEIQNMGLDIAKGRTDYDHPVPVAGRRYFPVQCQHCDNPPCVSVCPTKATWKEPDGPVLIDYSWCIGCRYCAAACPYQARHFNWHAPQIAPGEINPNQGYLSNRIRPSGVMEKCTFCLHRVRAGRLPACLEACPAGARVFGNLRDPKSEIRWVLEHRRTFVLKEAQATRPSFFYYLAE